MSSPEARSAVAGAVGGGRRGHQAADRARPGQPTRASSSRSASTPSSTWRGWTPRRPMARLLWAFDRPCAAPGTRTAGRRAALPRHGAEARGSAGQERGLHRPGGDARAAARQALRQRRRRGRPGAVRARRRGQDAARARVRAPLHGRLRPRLVGARRSGRRRSASRWPTWPARWSCGSATTWPRRPRRRSRSCAGTPSRAGCSSSTTPTTRSSSSRGCRCGSGHVIITSRNQEWTNTRGPARGGRLLQGGKRRPPAAPCAAPGPGRRQPGRGGTRRPAARDRAGERLA